MYTQTASHDDHHTPTGWKRWAYSTNHKELCGIKHAFMPITVRVVSEEDYQEWLSEARVKFAKEEIENDKLKLASK